MQIDSSRSDRCLVTIARSSMHEDDFCPTSYRRTNAVANCRIASLRESQRVVKMFLPLSGFDRNSCVSLSSIVNPRFASLAKNSVFSTEHCYWRGMDRRTILRGGTVRVYNFFKGFLDSRNSEMNSSLLYKREKKRKLVSKKKIAFLSRFKLSRSLGFREWKKSRDKCSRACLNFLQPVVTSSPLFFPREISTDTNHARVDASCSILLLLFLRKAGIDPAWLENRPFVA